MNEHQLELFKQNNSFERSQLSKRNLLCWTKMHAESGEALERIFQRKEMERRTGNGIFFWGIGNALDFSAFGADDEIPLLFSKMLSQPKAIDAAPTSVVVWQKYRTLDGQTENLPANCLITSRGYTATRKKLTHFALVCRSNGPVAMRPIRKFDPSAFRNAGGKKRRPGFSQVTALLEQVQSETSDTKYNVDFEAKLVFPFIISLVEPRILSMEERKLLASAKSDRKWAAIVRRIRFGESKSLAA